MDAREHQRLRRELGDAGVVLLRPLAEDAAGGATGEGEREPAVGAAEELPLEAEAGAEDVEAEEVELEAGAEPDAKGVDQLRDGPVLLPLLGFGRRRDLPSIAARRLVEVARPALDIGAAGGERDPLSARERAGAVERRGLYAPERGEEQGGGRSQAAALQAMSSWPPK